MSSPWHVQLRPTDVGIFRICYYDREGGFDLAIERGKEVLVAGGRWGSFDEAAFAANDLVNSCSRVQENPLGTHTTRGAKLAVTWCWEEKKWCIVAGYKPWRWEDSGLRFGTEREARKVLEDYAREQQ